MTNEKEPKSHLEKWADIVDEPKRQVAKDPDEAYKKARDRRDNQEQYMSAGLKGANASIRADQREDELINAIDDLYAIKRIAPTILKLQKKKISLEQAIRDTSSDAFIMLMKLAFSEGSDKVKADVLKHMLALAGHSPAQKHQIERIDSSSSKEALLAMISGAAKDLEKEGITVDDDRDEEEKVIKEDNLGYET
jgi:hypothetical protein